MTEVIPSSTNPFFLKTCITSYKTGQNKVDKMKFEVYNV